MTRTRWEAEEASLEVGDPVVLALRSCRLPPHYPLGPQSGAETV